MVETLIICWGEKISINLLNMKMLSNLLACDGRPDENPRFSKTLYVAIQHFKKYNLDALLISKNAPGLSAYNQVGRRMAPLSKALSGILSPHETFKTILDSSRKTIGTNLEKRNFKAVFEILAKVWEEIVLDNFPIVVDYVKNDPINLNEKWISVQCRISQYLLQIVRCNDSKCCGDFQTIWKSAFSSHFYQLLLQ